MHIVAIGIWRGMLVKQIDRVEGRTAIPSETLPGGASVAAKPLAIASLFPGTHYYELESTKAGATYAVWVTTPSGYDREPGRRSPAVYSPDGNRNMPFAAGLPGLAEWDLMDAFQPTIQICVGYTEEDAVRALAVRARDLLPPNEALPSGMIETMRSGPDNDVLDRAGVELYIRNLENPAGHRFLAFLTDELHPFIQQNYRIDPAYTGLFGHSYGGLFATYAALQPASIFRYFGASSPGIIMTRSAVFALYADAIAKGGLSERSLHMTVATREITDPGSYQAMVGAGTVEFMRLAGTNPLAGLTFSSQMFPEETHITVKAPAMHSFLRRFYLRAA